VRKGEGGSGGVGGYEGWGGEGLGRWLVIGEGGDMWILCGFEVW
jgi:hypothetical protein